MDNYEHSEGVPSTAAIGRHPIHPMLVPFPIGFLVGALISDIAYWALRDAFWAQASFWLVLAGLLTAAFAAIFGLTDFLTIRRARNATGWTHFLGNLTVVVLTLVSLILRLGDRVGAVLPWGLLISSVVGLCLLVTGWMGGELSFRYKVGVIGTERRTTDEALPVGQRQNPAR